MISRVKSKKPNKIKYIYIYIGIFNVFVVVYRFFDLFYYYEHLDDDK